MDPSNEIKSRLSSYIKGNSGLDEFRILFADVLRTSRQYEKPAQELIWAIDLALASFGSGRWSAEELRKELKRLAYIQAGKQIGVSSSASNVLQEAIGLRIEQAEIRYALVP